ncbi:MAG TPA: hypothetical protein VNT81_06370 [Vicinamibacterales bacterium]|nr:hypothetical protein [Vicinamibacterales bacterium]
MRIPLAIATFALAFPLGVSAQSTPSDLRIVVIEGENAVNIIQQKTAVRPLVEVRDRNNLPVAGATVTFTIGGSSAAFAGGAQTLTVTTNAVGQAAASGFSAVSSGAVQIQVQAAFNGQLATAAITQTNFATAAAATQAGAAASGAGGATGAGGGLSATTIGIVGGAVAAGAVAATQIAGKDDDSGGGGGNANGFDGYEGPLSGQIAILSESTGTNFSCTLLFDIGGTVRIELQRDGTGAASVMGTLSLRSTTNGCTDSQSKGIGATREQARVTGGPSAIAFSSTTATQGNLELQTLRFAGALTGNNINGTLSFDVAPGAGINPRRSGSASMPVTLVGPRP